MENKVWNAGGHAESSLRDKLIRFGYLPHQLIEHPDGRIELDLEKLRVDRGTEY